MIFAEIALTCRLQIPYYTHLRKVLIRALHILFFLLLMASLATAQQTVVYGIVKDADTGDPVPFANVYFKGSTIGVTTDFDGRYRLVSSNRGDTLVFAYMGYGEKIVAIQPGITQEVNVFLQPSVIQLQELVVVPGENPAWPIMREVIKRKKQHDKRSLEAYEYESYTKIEVDLDNLTERFKRSKVIQQATAVLDSIQVIAGENGRPIMPVFFSEALSRYYVKNNPFVRHEYVIKTKVTGLGLTDGTFTSQLIGATYQEYNFYKNFLTIVKQEFASPIANSWKSIYEYDLIDSMMLGEDYCYRIDFFPKRKHDLAFTGTMWITKEDYALKQIDATIGKKANLNFIEKLRVQQELMPTGAGPWLPRKTRVLIDIAQPSSESVGLLAKFYASVDKVVVNKPKPDDFYRFAVEMDEAVRMSDEAFWEQHRHEKLSQTEINVYNMVDTLKKIPVIKTYTDIAKLAYSGYYKAGPIDIGPYPLFLAYNDVEGLRLGFGAETNIDFSNKFILRGYGAYGFQDNRWKYNFGLEHIISRKPWVKTGVTVSREVDPVYLLNEPIRGQVAFYSFARMGAMRRPFLHDKVEAWLLNPLAKDVNMRTYARYSHLQPLFEFEYYTTPDRDPNRTQRNLTISEAGVEIVWSKDRKYLINDNYRVSAGYNRYPTITLRYTLGMKGVLDSDFNYHKVGLRLVKKFRMGQLGYSMLYLDGEYVFGTVPYPILRNHLGNETPFYSPRAYSLMNFFEFVSDHYASATYRHHFNGAIMNRVPLFKYLKLRLFGEARVLWGGMRQENIDIIVPLYDSNGNLLAPFKSLEEKPYIELGYGVENILKFIQVNFIHRITGFDQPDARRFGIKVGFYLTF